MEQPRRRPLSRRDAIRLGLAAGPMAWLAPSCQTKATAPGPPQPPPEEGLYRLAPGSALYDDFDGHGNFQTYDGLDLAVAGGLNTELWVVNEGVRVIAGPGQDPAGGDNHILEMACGGRLSVMAWLNSPRETSFADFGSFGADVMLSSDSTAAHPSATLDFHTTIPEQPPGRSWNVALGIFKDPGEPGAARAVGQYMNLNLGIIQNDDLGPARLDEWRTFRLDIVTKAGDPALGDSDLRLDYYLDGVLKASRIPEDSAILIDPSRTGLGPHRTLIVNRDSYQGGAVGYFDNVHAVYRDRTA
jgi:hypothetical protein